MIKICQVLCPVDFSTGSDHAMEYAMAFAVPGEATLHLLHVLQPVACGVGVDGMELASGAELLRNVENAARERLAEVVASTRKRYANVEDHFAVGVPSFEIVRFAGDHEIDLIVMGTHGRTGLAHVLIGSVAERVVQKAPCPVLTVKHPEHDFLVE